MQEIMTIRDDRPFVLYVNEHEEQSKKLLALINGNAGSSHGLEIVKVSAEDDIEVPHLSGPSTLLSEYISIRQFLTDHFADLVSN